MPLQYVANRTTRAITIDGRLNDAAWSRAPWTAAFTDIEGSIRPTPRFTTRVKMLWDDQYWYVAAELQEPDLWATIRTRDSVIFRDNDFELFVDPSGTAHRYFEVEMNQFATVWDLFLPKPYREGGHAVNEWNISGLQLAVALRGTINHPRDRDRGWTVELAIPWAAFADSGRNAVPPRAGRPMARELLARRVGRRYRGRRVREADGPLGQAAAGAQLGLESARSNRHARTANVGRRAIRRCTQVKRRTFLELLGAGAASAALAPELGASVRRDPFRAWTWVHGNDTEDAAAWRARFARFRAGGITGVVVGGGNTRLLAGAAHEEGLEFHAWTWILNRSGDAWVKANCPEWFDVNRNGDSSLAKPPYVGYYQWLCPSRPEVRDYLRGIVRNVAEIPGVDAVHLDYIRHPDVILPRGLWSKYNLVQDHEMPEYDYCYCTVCRNKFTAQSGYDPLSVADPTMDVAWREFRWNSISELVTLLSQDVRAHNRQISAAVFPTPALARMQVRQAWEKWPLDAVFPMTYHRFHDQDIPWIGAAVREGVAAIPRTELLYAGLHLPDLDPAALVQAVNVARDAGAAGVALYDSGGLTDAHLAALSSTAQ